VKDLCDLIDHAPSAAVDLLDMLTTAPKERRRCGAVSVGAQLIGRQKRGMMGLATKNKPQNMVFDN
jgi:hypothetical protein